MDESSVLKAAKRHGVKRGANKGLDSRLDHLVSRVEQIRSPNHARLVLTQATNMEREMKRTGQGTSAYARKVAMVANYLASAANMRLPREKDSFEVTIDYAIREARTAVAAYRQSRSE